MALLSVAAVAFSADVVMVIPPDPDRVIVASAPSPPHGRLLLREVYDLNGVRVGIEEYVSVSPIKASASCATCGPGCTCGPACRCTPTAWAASCTAVPPAARVAYTSALPVTYTAAPIYYGSAVSYAPPPTFTYGGSFASGPPVTVWESGIPPLRYGTPLPDGSYATPSGRPAGPGIVSIPGAGFPFDGPVRRGIRAGFGYDAGPTRCVGGNCGAP